MNQWYFYIMLAVTLVTTGYITHLYTRAYLVSTAYAADELEPMRNFWFQTRGLVSTVSILIISVSAIVLGLTSPLHGQIAAIVLFASISAYVFTAVSISIEVRYALWASRQFANRQDVVVLSRS